MTALARAAISAATRVASSKFIFCLSGYALSPKQIAVALGLGVRRDYCTAVSRYCRHRIARAISGGFSRLYVPSAMLFDVKCAY